MTSTETTYDSLDALSDSARSELRNILIACSDTKLLLGYHYGEWTFGTPELEAAVASCSLSQAELGHVRLFHAILRKHYGDDSTDLIEKRATSEFGNVTYLDNALPDWPAFVGANYAVDLGATRLIHSLRGSAFKPLRMSVEKIIDEERYHVHHGQGWFRTLAGDANAKADVEKRVSEAVTSVIEWLGPESNEADAELVELGIKSLSNQQIGAAFLGDVKSLSESLGISISVGDVDFAGWDPATRRTAGTAPDEEILYHLRGSKNEIFKIN